MAKEQSIQTAARNEIIGGGVSACCEPAFLSAAIRGCGEISLCGASFKLTLTSDVKGFIELCQRIAARRYGAPTVMERTEKNIGMRDITQYRLIIENTDSLLTECGILDGFVFIKGIPKELTARAACKKAYLKGMFLGCGSLSTPKDELTGGGTGYHLEFTLNSELAADDFILLLEKVCGFGKGIVSRRGGRPSIYLKSAQSISDCLAGMGASRAVMQLQKVMTTRAMSNHLNRGNNLIISNIGKSVSAAQRQLEAIEKIEKAYGLAVLDDKLGQAAFYRRKYPDATLAELAAIMGEGTKSRVNHRMRKLIEIAGKL